MINLPKHLQDCLVYAARYSHNRPTGAANVVVATLMDLWDGLDEQTQTQIIRESLHATESPDDWERLREFAPTLRDVTPRRLQAMTDQELNFELARKRGWTIAPSKAGPAQWVCQQERDGDSWFSVDIVPDYCGNLNEIHEAWKQEIEGTDLDDEYDFQLGCIVCGKDPKRVSGCGTYELESAAVNATARQRAEALLRTLGQV